MALPLTSLMSCEEEERGVGTSEIMSYFSQGLQSLTQNVLKVRLQVFRRLWSKLQLLAFTIIVMLWLYQLITVVQDNHNCSQLNTSFCHLAFSLSTLCKQKAFSLT